MCSAVYVLVSVPTEDRERELRGSFPTLFKSREKRDDTPSLKRLLETALDRLGVTDAVWSKNQTGLGYQICFSCDIETSDAILHLFSDEKFRSSKETSIG